MASLADLWESDTQPNLQGLNPALADKLSQAQIAYKQQFGKDLPITSGYRTIEDQKRLASQPNKYLVAKPGTSLHEKGDAVDISSEVPDSFLNQFGLQRPFGKKDPVHTTLMPQSKSFADLWDQTETEQSNKESPVETSLIQQFANKRRELGENTAAALDILASAPSAIAQTVGYGTGRLFGLSPQEALQASSRLSNQLENPIGRTLNVNQNQGYKESYPSELMDFVSKYFNKGAEWIAQQTGMNVTDAQQAINAATMVGGPVMGKLSGKAIRAGKTAYEEIKPEIQQEINPQKPVESKQLSGVGASATQPNPYKLTGEESAKGQYPIVKPSKIAEDVSPQEQSTRAEIANEILGTGQVRPGVITGNENTLRNEYTEAKSSNITPRGELLKNQIAEEQNALSNYAKNRIENTGADPRLLTDYERGERINDAFYGDNSLIGLIKNEKQKFFDDVQRIAGNNPINTSHVDNLFNNQQFRAGLGLKGQENVARSAENLIKLAKEVGFEDEAGVVHGPNTVGAWNSVKKALNENWTHENANTIRKINQAIEKDIGAAGGLELLKKADSLHQAEKTLFSSKGMKTLFGDVDPNGIQNATAFEQIPKKMNAMPIDQWRHVFDTVDKVAQGKIFGPFDEKTGQHKWVLNVPPEVQIAAQNAKNEIMGNLAREVYRSGAKDLGTWNYKAANETLNARAEKIKHAFPLSEQQAFHKLNYGGQIMPGSHFYEGSGLQTQRVQGLLESHAPKAGAGIGTVVGSTIAGPVGGAVGGYLGGKGGTKLQTGLEQKALQKSAQKLQEEMQNASKKSNKISDIGKTK